MLPSRGLAKSPASALRCSIANRTKPTRTISTRQFSQTQTRSTSPVLSRHVFCQTGLLQSGRVGSGVPAAKYVTPLDIASSVFAQRSGATRNLSLWPFGSKPKDQGAPVADVSPTSSTPSTFETKPSQAHAQAIPPSTSTEPVHDAAVSSSSLPPESHIPQTNFDQFHEDLLRELDVPAHLNVPEHIGFLGELGLDYGWGTTTICQWILEHLHISLGLPWWGALASMAFVFRGILFIPTMTGAKHAAALQKVQADPEYLQAKADFQESRLRTRDQAAASRHQMKMARMFKQSGASWWRPFVGFAMIPFSFGIFRLVRGMADVPVLSMETGGLAWFTDLTVHDPFFMLPIAAVGLTALTLKQTQAARMTIEPQQEAIMKIMLYAMPPLMFLGTAWLPAGLQWFFLTMSMGSAVQGAATLSPPIRRYFGMPPLPTARQRVNSTIPTTYKYQKPTTPAAPAAPTTIRGQLQQSMSSVTDKFKEATGATEENSRWKSVQAYEEKRAEQDRDRAQRRLDEMRRRRKR